MWHCCTGQCSGIAPPGSHASRQAPAHGVHTRTCAHQRPRFRQRWLLGQYANTRAHMDTYHAREKRPMPQPAAGTGEKNALARQAEPHVCVCVCTTQSRAEARKTRLAAQDAGVAGGRGACRCCQCTCTCCGGDAACSRGTQGAKTAAGLRELTQVDTGRQQKLGRPMGHKRTYMHAATDMWPLCRGTHALRVRGGRWRLVCCCPQPPPQPPPSGTEGRATDRQHPTASGQD